MDNLDVFLKKISECKSAEDYAYLFAKTTGRIVLFSGKIDFDEGDILDYFARTLPENIKE